MTKEVKMYKIRNSKGLFSTGGMSPSFSKVGKIWSNIGHVKNHLNTGVDISVYDDCELVEVITICQSVDENGLQKMYEQSIVKSSLDRPTYESADVFKLLKRYVITGKCYSAELKDYIENKRTHMVEYLIPDYILENFDLFHNKGIEGCSDQQLAAIILTATKDQQKLYSL